jgi:uncharacterized protein
MPTLQDWFYIRNNNQLAIAPTVEEGNFVVKIAEPDNLVRPAQVLIRSNIDSSNGEFPQPVNKMPMREIKHHEGSVEKSEQNGVTVYTSKIFGLATMHNQELAIVPPVYYNKDRTVAFLFLDKSILPFVPNKDEIITVLKFLDLTGVLNLDAIAAELAKADQGLIKQTPLAKGKVVQHGWYAYVEPTINLHKKAGTMKEDGSIDFKERKSVNDVQQGMEVATFFNEMTPVDGITVFGEKVEAIIESKGLKMGKNLVIDESQPSVVKAAKTGLIKSENNELFVDETLVIETDVDYETGNIEFFGNIEIRGNVLQGFKVNCFGNLIVEGNVEGGEVFASGDINILGGIIGKGQGRVQTQSSLAVTFCQSAVAFADGDIKVRDFAYHSQLTTNSSFLCVEKRGIIVGGTTISKRVTEVNVAGNEDGAPTLFLCGIDQDFEKLLEEKKAEKESVEKRHIALGKKIGEVFTPQIFRSPELVLRKLDEARRAKAIQVLDELKKMEALTKSMQAKIENLAKNGPTFDFTPDFTANMAQHDGVKVRFPGNHIIGPDDLKI